jgi:hypothetical protein
MNNYGNQSSASQDRAATKPTHDAVALRAYDIYVKTGRKQGQCKQNWQQAETELQTAGHRS